MCGIAGVVRFDGLLSRDREAVAGATEALWHRGPDSGGLWESPSHLAAFGHRRLSIIDLSSRADQPFVDEETGTGLVFNGEIYNYRTLRAELRACGAAFQTDSDTEVLLRAYLRYGAKVFDHLRGMFAFAIWDERRRRLTLARDFCGQKPLFFRESGGAVAFASEIGALKRLCPECSDLDGESLDAYCKYWCIPAPRTLVKGFSKVAAAHYMDFDEKGQSTHRYWFPLRAAARYGDLIRHPDDWEVLLAEKVQEAVTATCVSDVPVGIAFSGGSDSVAVATCALNEMQKMVAFSIENPEANNVEEEDIRRRFCAAYGITRHSVSFPSSQIQRWIRQYMPRFDEPIGDNTVVYSSVLAEHVRSHNYKVFLTGEGGDEIFIGYPWWAHLIRWSKRIRFSADVLGKLFLLLPSGQQGRAVARLLQRASRGGGPEVYWDSQLGLPDPIRRRLFPKTGETGNEYVRTLRREFIEEGGRDDAQWFTYLDLNLRLPELLLPRLDRTSMLFGTEARSPLLERDLVEFVLGMPEAVKIPGYKPKGCYFRYLSKKVPEDMLIKRKIGYNAGVRASLSDYSVELRSNVTHWNRQLGLFPPNALESAMTEDPGATWPLFALSEWDGRARCQSVEAACP